MLVLISSQDFWSAPFTKSGKSSLVPKGPWMYAMTGIGVYYKADPSLLNDVVPKPLKVVDGDMFSYLTEIVSWSPNAVELAVEAPEQLQYSEGAFFVKVDYNGKNYLYCPYMWVDNDLSLLRGLLAGWPKKLAKIAITRLHPLLPPLERPKKGLKVGGYLARAGSTLYRIKVELTSDVESDRVPLLSEYSFILPRYFAGVAPGLTTVNELVEFEGEAVVRSWEGLGHIDVIGGVNDELYFFKPVSEVRGFYFLLLLKVRGLRNLGMVEGF
ncbi:MAG: acetoacetate decarboxylase family protein [Sulfolobales archaeon]